MTGSKVWKTFKPNPSQNTFAFAEQKYFILVRFEFLACAHCQKMFLQKYQTVELKMGRTEKAILMKNSDLESNSCSFLLLLWLFFRTSSGHGFITNTCLF